MSRRRCYQRSTWRPSPCRRAEPRTRRASCSLWNLASSTRIGSPAPSRDTALRRGGAGWSPCFEETRRDVRDAQDHQEQAGPQAPPGEQAHRRETASPRPIAPAHLGDHRQPQAAVTRGTLSECTDPLAGRPRQPRPGSDVSHSGRRLAGWTRLALRAQRGDLAVTPRSGADCKPLATSDVTGRRASSSWGALRRAAQTPALASE